ncbi:lipopolysaccharide heptosyltransferase I [Polynucleobacter sp. UK-Kesae-W10]|uniref:lipopolysaccharide heptosyltransferase I n=1 Tax=Polynucleobacter sp. UK-Kesae-W10 TaxID=1819738 RepID=UPI001C0AB03F|nr:lipopolysaccharide heptosyltransferase I [Polynucleobacter sp. UK-Kesae-W10]MBU3576876.1 lipopolysaccharide heptosyltransferase I [Polynucleobacter sp. UK-Kesae-W10]
MSNTNATPKILLVKLSSLGDVLHNLPIVWDIRARLPEAQIDWVVEEGYVHLLKPLLSREGFRGIDRIIPFGLRRWKKSLFGSQTWTEFFQFKKDLQQVSYDVIIETQGLLKSALVCALAKKSSDAVVAGLANATEYSGYEPAARSFYNQSVQVPFHCHAVDRSRYVTSSALDWPLIARSEGLQFYPASYVNSIAAPSVAGLNNPYIVFFHSTAREAKRWPKADWVSLGVSLASHGYQIVLPWGSAAEKAISQELATQIPGALVPAAFSIEEAFSVVAHAALIVGVDTGLTHLAAVLNQPTVEIYCDSPRWKTEGYWSERIRNVGDIQASPTTAQVLGAATELLNAIKN